MKPTTNGQGAGAGFARPREQGGVRASYRAGAAFARSGGVRRVRGVSDVGEAAAVGVGDGLGAVANADLGEEYVVRTMTWVSGYGPRRSGIGPVVRPD